MLYRLNWPKINDILEGFELESLPSSSFTASNSVRRASSLRGSEDTEGMETLVSLQKIHICERFGWKLSKQILIRKKKIS
uniref:Uncharacterized protein n=1 Tax=Meloidogyne incognita TaxID=6306 RepID=A0A914NBM0_MELIC